MATESADGSELSVSLPQPLEEWVDERAAALDVDREELLVQVLSAYRAAADLSDEDALSGDGDPAAVDERIETEVRTQLDDLAGDTRATDERLEELEAELEEDLETVRNRVLQLRDAVRNRAKTDHSHEEFTGLREDIDEVATDVADLADVVSALETDVADVTTKLDTLARVILDMKHDGGDGGSEAHRTLEQLRAAANRRGVTDGSCHACGESVSIPLLSEPACPHCQVDLRDITTTGIIFKRATLTGPDPEPEPDGDVDE